MATHKQHQDELWLSSVAPHAVFPGRTTLYVKEVAAHLEITEQHVMDLIAEGQLKAINIAGDITGGTTEKGRAKKQFMRVPVSALDEFQQSRRSDK